MENQHLQTPVTFRTLVGLQFFAEDAGDMGGDASADDGFLMGLDGETVEGMEDVEDIDADADTDAPDNDDLDEPDESEDTPIFRDAVLVDESIPAEPPAEQPEQQPEPQQPQQPEQTLNLTYNGRQIPVPANALHAISQSLGGADPIALIQKGMNYERKGEREAGILQRYANANGMSYPQYVDMLEKSFETASLQGEMQALRNEYGEGVPDKALEALARGNIAQRAQQAQVQQQQAMQQQQQQQAQRAQQMSMQNRMQQARQQMEVQQAWQGYFNATGLKEPSPELLERMKTDNRPPLELHYKMEAERLQKQLAADNQKKRNTRMPGGQRSQGDAEADAFLSGLGMY